MSIDIIDSTLKVGHPHYDRPSIQNESLSVQNLIKKSSGIFILICIAYLFSFIFNLILARWLGPLEYGIVSLVLRFFGILLPLLAFGVDGVFIKHIQTFIENIDYSKLSGVLHWGTRIFIIVSFIYFLCGAILLSLSHFLFFNHQFEIELDIFLKGIWLPPFLTLLYIGSSLLRALRCFYSSVIFSWASTLFLASLFILSWHFLYGNVGTIETFIAIGIAVVISIILQFLVIIQNLPNESFAVDPIYQNREWFSLGFYIMLSNTLSTVSVLLTMILLDVSGTSKLQIAHFFVVFIIANIFIILGKAITSLIGPWINILDKQKKINKLQWLINITNYFKLIVGMIFLLIILIYGKSILLWFGQAYNDMHIPLILLSIMNFVSICFGSSIPLLLYTNQQKFVNTLRIVQVCLLLILCMILIRPLGVTGAVLANGISLIVFELSATVKVKRTLNISIFGL